MRRVVTVTRFLKSQAKLWFPFLFVSILFGVRFLDDAIPLFVQFTVWILLLLTAVLIYRSGLEYLCGPVYYYDLIKSSRRGGIISHRVLLAVLLLAWLFFQYSTWFPRFNIFDPFASQHVSSAEPARFANSFFWGLIALQMLVVFLLTPIYTSGAIAEQKERRQLEFLFVTDLTTREIVYGTLASRLSRIGLLLLTGLPILSFLELLGGVDPDLVLMSYAFTILFMFCLGSVCISESVKAKTAAAAILPSYASSFIVLIISLFFSTCCFGTAGVALMRSTNIEKAGILTALVLAMVAAGYFTITNCNRAVATLRKLTLADMGKASPIIPETWTPHRPDIPVLEFADPEAAEAFRRRRAARMIAERIGDLDPRVRKIRARPPIGSDALLWKESSLEHSYSFFYEKGWIILFLIGGYLLFVNLVGWVGLRPGAWNSQTPGTFRSHFVTTVRYFGWFLCSMPLALITLSAACRISREKERQTLESLLTISCSWTEILLAKWIGSILSVRMLWIAPVGWFFFASLIGAIHFTSFFFLLGAIGTYAAFFSMLGLWLSSVAGSTLRASLFAVLIFSLAFIGPGVAMQFFTGPYITVEEPEAKNMLTHMVTGGLSPLMTISELCYRYEDIAPEATASGARYPHVAQVDAIAPRDLALAKYYRLVGCLGGLTIYMVLTIMMWLMTCKGLHDVKGPRPRRHPLRGTA